MTDFIKRVQVIATAFVTWAVFASAVVSAALVELEPYQDVPYVGVAIKWGGVAVSAIAAAVAVVRRVSTVPVPERGVLPQPAQNSFWGPR